MTELGIRTRITIGQWNVRTLRETSRLAQLEKQLTTYRIDIMGISEMRWIDSGEITTANGNKVLFSGKPSRAESGVGIVIGKRNVDALINWKAISDRIILARFRGKVRHLTTIQCYAPTEDAEDDDKDKFYEHLIKTINSTSKRDVIVLMGDLNAKVGCDNNNTEKVMGKHGIGDKNNNGDRLIDLCQTSQMVIGGTIFPHKRIHKYTWTSPDGRTQNQIDHICISRKWRSSLIDVRTRRGADMDTDHELVTAIIKMKIKGQKQQKHLRRKKPNLAKLKNNNIKETFNGNISSATSTNRSWDGTAAIYNSTAIQTLGQQEPKRKLWLTDDTWNKVKKRNKIKLRINNNKNNNDNSLRQEYRNVAKMVKRAARRDKRNYINSLAEQAEEASATNNMRKLHQIIGDLTNHKAKCQQPIRDRNGTLLTTNEQQLERWRQHFEETSNSVPQSYHTPNFILPNNNNTLAISCSAPTVREIEEAISKQKTNKAAGEDGMYAELLLADPQMAAKLLHPHLQQAWQEEHFPSTWKKGVIIKIPKKGDLRDCGNWRGITLLNMIYKITANIVHKRIQEKLESSLREEQAGFRPDRSCIDQSNTLRIIVEQCIEWQTPLYMVFVDFKKAFDMMNRSSIWACLKKKGVPDKLINIIRALYDGSEVSVLHNGTCSNIFTTNAGVKQGCPLSPLLFTIVLDEIMREVCSIKRGITWTFSSHLEDLDFADDICLLSHKISDMQSKLDHLQELAKKVGLEINVAKTKAMRINNNSSHHILLNNQRIEYVNKFCYLGSIITTSGGTKDDVANRINRARAAFGRLNAVWRSTQISRNTKLRIFKACVKSILLYGCETWLVSIDTTRKLQVCLNKCLRIIHKIFWPATIRNQDLWQLANEEEIGKQIKRRKWRWIGHTLRKEATNITRMALKWNPQGSRKRGRPNNTWRRSVKNELNRYGFTWDDAAVEARDRLRWRNQHVEALCSIEE